MNGEENVLYVLSHPDELLEHAQQYFENTRGMHQKQLWFFVCHHIGLGICRIPDAL